MTTKKISDLAPGEKGTVCMIRGGGDFHKHLHDIGVTFGGTVQIYALDRLPPLSLRPAPVYPDNAKYLVTCTRPNRPRTIAALSGEEAACIYVDTV